MLYAGYTLAGYANGHIYSVVGQVLNSNFSNRSGAVSGGMLFVTGFGALFMGAMEQMLAERIGITKMCLLLSVILFLSIFICSHWLTLPENRNQYEAAHGTSSNTDISTLTFRQVIKLPTFLMFFAWAVLLASGGLLAINNAANIFDYYKAPAVAGLIVMLFTGIGCQLMGIFMDRVGLRASMAFASAFSFAVTVLLLAGHWSGETTLILIGVLLCGVGYGTTTSAKMAGAVKLYGSQNLTTVFVGFLI